MISLVWHRRWHQMGGTVKAHERVELSLAQLNYLWSHGLALNGQDWQGLAQLCLNSAEVSLLEKQFKPPLPFLLLLLFFPFFFFPSLSSPFLPFPLLACYWFPTKDSNPRHFVMSFCLPAAAIHRKQFKAKSQGQHLMGKWLFCPRLAEHFYRKFCLF